MKKGIKQAVITTLFLLTITLNAFAASQSDYTALKYGKVADAGTNTVTVSGKGFLGITTAQGPDSASAILYNTAIDPRNFEAKLTFVKDYGKGEGVQAGWYAINFSKTKNWFSSNKDVIKQSKISGVTIIFKLNPNNKKSLTLELNRYLPGSGFTNLVGSSILLNMAQDWSCNVKITKGQLSIDGKSVLDLNDAIDLAVGEKGYVGFGGFSENHYDIEMKAEYKGATSSTSPTSTTSTKKPSTNSTATTASRAQSSGASSNTNNSTESTSATSSSDTTLPSQSTASAGESTSGEQTTDAPESTTSSKTQASGGEVEDNDFNPIWIVLGIVLLAAAGGAAYYLLKVKGKGSITK